MHIAPVYLGPLPIPHHHPWFTRAVTPIIPHFYPTNGIAFPVELG